MVLRDLQLVELNEVTVANCGGDMADAVVLVVSVGKNKEHADEMGLVLHDAMPFAMELYQLIARVAWSGPSETLAELTRPISGRRSPLLNGGNPDEALWPGPAHRAKCE
jgi:hypothetical protein